MYCLKNRRTPLRLVKWCRSTWTANRCTDRSSSLSAWGRPSALRLPDNARRWASPELSGGVWRLSSRGRLCRLPQGEGCHPSLDAGRMRVASLTRRWRRCPPPQTKTKQQFSKGFNSATSSLPLSGNWRTWHQRNVIPSEWSEASPFWTLIWHGCVSNAPECFPKVCWGRRLPTAWISGTSWRRFCRMGGSRLTTTAASGRWSRLWSDERTSCSPIRLAVQRRAQSSTVSSKQPRRMDWTRSSTWRTYSNNSRSFPFWKIQKPWIVCCLGRRRYR